jgi:hypothetical protein
VEDESSGWTKVGASGSMVGRLDGGGLGEAGRGGEARMTGTAGAGGAVLYRTVATCNDQYRTGRSAWLDVSVKSLLTGRTRLL